MLIPAERIIAVVLGVLCGGLVGWMLLRLPMSWVYGVSIALAILMVLVFYAR